MMISIIIAALGKWEEYTRPFIDSLLLHEPDVEIIVVDSLQEYPSEYKTVTIIRTPLISYAEAINRGAYIAKGDWIMNVNNDVRCDGKFAHLIHPLSKDALYARQIIEEGEHRWFGNWLVVVPFTLFDELGGFDKGFERCGFEDADFAIRAKQKGYETKPIELPFTHFWGKTRWDKPDYPKVRIQNIEYFERKHGFRLGNNMRVTHD